MLAAIYLRVSTEDQARHGYSLADQRTACQEKAYALGASEVREFVDEGISGELLDRPGLIALREAVRAKQVDVVICYDPDRLARNLAHQLLLTDEIEKSGVTLDFVNFEWKNTPDGKLFYSMRGAIAEYEKEKIRERTVRGKLQKARQGGLPVQADCYGYIYENGNIKPHPAESEVVKMIFQWFITEDIGINGIAVRLSEQGVPTRKGKSKWQRCVVRTILCNPTYKGTFYYNRLDCKNVGYNKYLPPEKRAKRRKKPKEEWIPISVPAIIDEETFNKAQEKLANIRRQWSGWSKEKYLLSGLVSCTNCGNTMHGWVKKEWGGKRVRYYTCVKTHAGASNYGCKPIKRVRADIVENAVWEQVCTWLNNPDKLTAEIQESTKEKNLRADLDRIEKHLADVERGRDNIRSALAAGLFELDEKTAQTLNELKRRKEQLKNRKKEIEAALRHSETLKVQVREIRKQAERFLSQLDNLSFEQKKALIRTLVRQVTVTGRGEDLRITVYTSFIPEVVQKGKEL